MYYIKACIAWLREALCICGRDSVTFSHALPLLIHYSAYIPGYHQARHVAFLMPTSRFLETLLALCTEFAVLLLFVLWLMKMATFVYCDLQVIFQRSPILKKQYTHHIVQFAVKSTIQYSRSRGTCGKFLMEALHPIQFTLRALHTYSISYTLADMKFLNNFHDPIFGQKNVTQEKPGIATFFYSQ